MIQILIGNSLCHVKDVTTTQMSELRDACAYYKSTGQKRPIKGVKDKSGKLRWFKIEPYKVKQAIASGAKIRWIPDKVKCHLMDTKGAFPTGLLYLIEEFLRKKGWEYESKDTRKFPRLYTIAEDTLYVQKKYEPYPEQVEAAKAAIEHGRGIVVGPTGVGKSTICELICDAFRVNTLIVVPSLELKRQLTASLTEAFGIGMVGPLGKSSEPKYPITVENVDALSPSRKLKHIDCLIIDEFHHSAASTYRKLNLKSWTDIYFKIGLTATPFRANEDERLLLESVLSKVIYRIEYKTAVEKGYIVPMEAYYIDLPKLKRVKDIASYHTAYSHFVVKNDYRNALIADMTANLIEAGKSTLVLTKQIAHGLALQSKIEERGYHVPFAEGTNELKGEYIRDFCSLKEPALIGTVGVLGEGVDTKPAEWIILAGGGKSKNQFMQNVGRGFRKFGDKESCKIVLIRDPNNKWLLEHFNACVKYLEEEYGIIPTKLDLGT